jgi:hypothetical protein
MLALIIAGCDHDGAFCGMRTEARAHIYRKQHDIRTGYRVNQTLPRAGEEPQYDRRYIATGVNTAFTTTLRHAKIVDHPRKMITITRAL